MKATDRQIRSGPRFESPASGSQIDTAANLVRCRYAPFCWVSANHRFLDSSVGRATDRQSGRSPGFESASGSQSLHSEPTLPAVSIQHLIGLVSTGISSPITISINEAAEKSPFLRPQTFAFVRRFYESCRKHLAILASLIPDLLSQAPTINRTLPSIFYLDVSNSRGNRAVVIG